MPFQMRYPNKIDLEQTILMPRLPNTGFLEDKVLLLLDGECEVNLLIAKPYEKGRTHQILQ